jgi:hypothetical protein
MKVKSGKIKKPLKIILAGVEGVGKTSWAADAPKPIFLDLEDGSAHLDVDRVQAPDGGWSYQAVLDVIAEMTRDSSGYQTLVIDTLDALEPLVWAHICKRDKKSDIEDYGWGKGYVAALDEWRRYVYALERLSETGVHIIMIAHVQIKTFRNPCGPDYDRYVAKLADKAGAFLREWSDAVLFAAYAEDYVVDKTSRTKARGGAEDYVVDKMSRAKARGGDVRVIHTERMASWDAKNRYSLPPTMPLCWDDFAGYVGGVGRDDVVDRIVEMLTQIDDEKIKTWTRNKIESKSLSIAELQKIANRLAAKIETSPHKEEER